MIDFQGTPFTVVINGDRGHEFTLPRDRTALHPKVAEAFAELENARSVEQKGMARNSNNYAAKKEANDATRDALHHVYDTAASISKAARQQHEEAFEYAARRYARAIGEAQAALQTLVTAAQLHDMAEHGHNIGINPAAKTPAVTTARLLSVSLDQLPPLPPIDAE
jgi:hypothetical protein